MRKRIIPLLLLHDGGLCKTVKFKSPRYVGDPINILKIFNEKEVDELIVLDIDAARTRREPDYDLLRSMVDECFCPLAYGGGVSSTRHISKLINLGIEKVVINSACAEAPGLIEEAATAFGRSSIVASIDYASGFFGGAKVHIRGGQKQIPHDPVSWAKELDRRGAGEICLNSIDLDGTRKGYDLDMISKVSSAVSVPVIAAGGAGTLSDLTNALSAGASAAAAGSLFVFQGRHQAVLVTYPSEEQRAGV